MAEIFFPDRSVQEPRHLKFECCCDQGQVVILMVDEKDCGKISSFSFCQVMQDLQASHAWHFEAGDEQRWKRVVQVGRFNEPESFLTV
jgi:hypothetical protein